MSHEVYANGNQVAGKAGKNKSIARFPDVCMSPPGPPAGPLPVPYPDTSFSTDLKNGSKRVKLNRKPGALAQRSFYKPKVLGDEAATRAWGMNVVTHQITGKTYFQAWSMDVKIEGKQVCRHLDLTTSNHASTGTTTAPNASAEKAAKGDPTKCPCCGDALHENQKDDNGDRLPTISRSQAYQRRSDFFTDRAKQLSDYPALENASLKGANAAAEATKFLSPGEPQTVANVIRGKARYYNARNNELKRLMAANPDCPNLHPEDDPCNTHFDTDTKKRKRPNRDGKGGEVEDTPAGHARREFSSGVRNQSIANWQSKLDAAGKKTKIPKGDKVNHKTPLEAGGCPKSQKNLIPDTAVKELGGDACMQIEKLQTELQNAAA